MILTVARGWCPGQGSNLHDGITHRGILSPLCLPVSPPGRLRCDCLRRNWRRGSESNRRPRLCRPLHDHSATPPLALNAFAALPTRNTEAIRLFLGNLERERSLELPTLTLARLRSTN